MMRAAKFQALIALVLVLVILVGANVLVGRYLPGVRADLTAGRVYTLSAGTREVLGGLKQPVTLRLYYSRKLGAVIPSYGALADRVQQMLGEYARLSHGMLRVRTFDPEPYSDTEDRAIADGMQGVPLDQGGEQVYFGLAGSNQLDTERSISFFKAEREAFLEYDLTRLVYELSDPTRPVVGLMTSLPMQGDPRAMMMGGKSQPWTSLAELQQSFAVTSLPLDTTVIPPDIKVLLVAQAQHLSQPTLYAIDQFVMRGGRLLAMVDPHSEMEASQPSMTGQPVTDTESDLTTLFDKWGIVFDPKQVVGDLDGAWRVRSSSASDRVQAVDYVAWINIRDGLSHDDPATADLKQVSVAAAGQISLRPDSGLTLTPLLSSSPDRSAMIDVASVQTAPNPARILADFKPDGQRHVIAARISGPLKSAFDAAPKQEAPDKDAAAADAKPADLPPYRAHTEGAANLVVIADTDIMGDRFWVRVADFFGEQTAVPFADNGAFISNLVGTLAGGDALMGLRGRGVTVRPFAYIDRMTETADARYRQTEQGLLKHLEDVQKQLAGLRGSGGDASQAVITPAQAAAVEEARRDVMQTRQKLRLVQLDLRRDIATLEDRLRVIDIAAVPAVLTLIAIGIAVLRARRRARARA